MNPDVLQFINRMVDLPAACRSCYAQCTVCSRTWTVTSTVLGMVGNGASTARRVGRQICVAGAMYSTSEDRRTTAGAGATYPTTGAKSGDRC